MGRRQITESIKAEDFEKAGVIISEIAQCVDFRKKFQLTIDYDPERINTVIQYSEL